MSSALPNFFYAGAPKAGSSSLVAWLKQHPEIFFGARKEPMFFGWELQRGIDYYRSLYEGYGGQPIVADATVWAFGHKEVPAQIASVIPSPKILFVLRDPVERAFSHYWHDMQAGKIPMSQPFSRELNAPDDPRFVRHFSEYGRHLQRWYAQFGGERILVLRYEELKQPGAVLRKVCEFLGIRSDVPIDTRRGEMLGRSPRFPRLLQALQSHPDALAARALGEGLGRALRFNWRFERALFTDGSRTRPQVSRDDLVQARALFSQDLTLCEELTGLDLSSWKA
jgi:hypothetical protein